ncbi:MAG: PDZ domain-containing protein [Candidatus Schekmanbacteria bacterium]|nr:PDZ domain-containing protein [Candidatus Schekmanbacteria bacterium]
MITHGGNHEPQSPPVGGGGDGGVAERRRRRRRRARALLLLAVGATAGAVWYRLPALHETPRLWLGISIIAVDVPENGDVDGASRKGIRVDRVAAESPAAAHGLRSGDIIEAIDGRPLGGSGDQVIQELWDAVGDRHEGDALRLGIVREETTVHRLAGDLSPEAAARVRTDLLEQAEAALRGALAEAPPGATVALQGQRQRQSLTVDVPLVARPLRAPRASASPPPERWLAAVPAVSLEAVLAARWLSTRGRPNPIASVLAELRAEDRPADACRLSLAAAARRYPWQMLALAQRQVGEIGAAFAATDTWSSAALLRALAVLADEPRAGIGAGTGTTTGGRTRLEQMEVAVGRSRTMITRAFDDLSEADRQILATSLATPAKGGAAATGEIAPRQLLEVAEKIDHEALYAAALALASVLERDFLLALERELRAEHAAHLTDPVLVDRAGPAGRTVVSGTARNRHRGEVAALAIDLGGDDVYADGTAAARWPGMPVAVAVDFAGDDAYQATAAVAQAAAVGGIAVLVDLAGDDSYLATTVAQGSAIAGIGLLLDAAGDDAYRGQELTQGVGQVGAGILADLGGADTYEAGALGQGLGLSRGIGLLLDLTGNDRYYLKGRYANDYGDPGLYNGLGQGCGFGDRDEEASGGAGILIDAAGHDRFEGGHFSQGGGVYHGWGVLWNGGDGDDTYVGSRYNQGFSAHFGAGLLYDEGGDDRYSTLQGAAQGLAWDLSASVFVDARGRDTYWGGEFFSQGAAAQSAFALFVDRGGQDRYGGADDPGIGGPNEYHEGTSFALAVDAGGDADEYEHGAQNNDAVARGELALRLDLAGTVSGELAAEAP